MKCFNLPREILNHPLQRMVIFHASGDSNWATVTLPVVEELEILQDGILLPNHETVAAGLFHYAGDGQELPKVTSCGDIASNLFCNTCKCANAGDLEFCIPELRRYQACSFVCNFFCYS
jgi:hypothetical protein